VTSAAFPDERADEERVALADDDSAGEGLEPHLRRVRAGHGANCSSIGSVVDTLFATAVVGAAVFAAVAAALKSEEARMAGKPKDRP
jgi:hypothetical protein